MTTAALTIAPAQVRIAQHCVYFHASAAGANRLLHRYPAYWSDDLRECEIFVQFASIEPRLSELDALYQSGQLGLLDHHFQEIENATKARRTAEIDFENRGDAGSRGDITADDD